MGFTGRNEVGDLASQQVVNKKLADWVRNCCDYDNIWKDVEGSCSSMNNQDGV